MLEEAALQRHDNETNSGNNDVLLVNAGEEDYHTMPGQQINVKILVLGPSMSGKTSIANYLADSQDAVSKDYRPTQGVRIVEFESNQLELEGDRVNAEVELWDCGGDRNFESCWPAIRHRCNGIIFVCNPELSTGNDLLIWYSEFALRAEIGTKNLLVLLHHTNESTNHSAIAAFRLPTEMGAIPVIPSDIDREGDVLRLAFNNFLCDIIADVHSTAQQ
uniref:Intraflagellar transport protein 22 homolog n=1 Tax=Globodera pallida TaxID=36090 RepID=A0A183BYN9_GLOPA